ncbi:MAG TPA: hypothetical protein PLN24_09185 [Victivallales bacterium]|nr:hypothetical protein [Victivallales bacterium]
MINLAGNKLIIYLGPAPYIARNGNPVSQTILASTTDDRIVKATQVIAQGIVTPAQRSQKNNDIQPLRNIIPDILFLFSTSFCGCFRIAKKTLFHCSLLSHIMINETAKIAPDR